MAKTLREFCCEFLKTNDYTNFIMIIDRFNKNMIFEFMKQIRVENVTWIFIQIIFWRHRLSWMIILNRNQQSVKHVWRIICKLLKILWKLSTTYYSQTNLFKLESNIAVLMTKQEKLNWIKKEIAKELKNRKCKRIIK